MTPLCDNVIIAFRIEDWLFNALIPWNVLWVRVAAHDAITTN